jgi:hypothetical protein
MKPLKLLAATLICAHTTFAQRTIEIKNLWAKPEVSVLFQGYTLSFTIKDINRAMTLLRETGDSTYGPTSNLDPNRHYSIELYPGFHTEYLSPLQPLMQRGVGSFLLLAGHAVVKNRRHRKLSTIIGDIQPINRDDSFALVNFYDPKNNHMIFSGRMRVNMYNQDLGIE